MDYHKNQFQRSKFSSLKLWSFAFFLVVMGYSGYRYFSDSNLYKTGYSAYQSGDQDLAYSNFYSIEESFRIIDIGNFKTKARDGITACAATEFNSAQNLMNSQKLREAFDAFSLLRDHANIYEIEDYKIKSVEGLQASYYTILKNSVDAYDSGDCKTAIKDGQWAVDKNSNAGLALDLSEIHQNIDNCNIYIEEVVNIDTSNPEKAADSFSLYIIDFSDIPLADFAMEKLFSLIDVYGFDKIASYNSCLVLTWENERSPLDDQANYLFYCGSEFVNSDYPSDAISLLTDFTEKFPNDSRYQQAIDMLAELLINDARESGAEDLPSPSAAGKVKSGSSSYSVQNNTPYSIRIVFSGPQNIVKTIPACSSCKEYRIDPYSCPNLGPEIEFNLIPGEYSILVETESEKGVTPYTGNYMMKDGTGYADCFYIVTSFQ